MDPFLTLLNSFSSRLSEGELASLKFLCQDKIGKRKLESIQTARELFSILIEQRLLTRHDVTFLEELLTNIKRQDLVLQLKQFVEEGEANAPDDEPDVHEKRRLRVAIKVICDNVGREWKQLMRELDFSDVQMDRVIAANPQNLREQFIQSLREWQKSKGKDAKVTDLIQALRSCKMNLAADRVEQELQLMNTGTS
ncbi:FAS-associated death domain protein [Cuculus canorus]|uniref:FAS-associated death domain protein n=1 Tax=Cuculus canorus TaxID=55661 RepID=UPI0023AACE64|nr:FAS-associated death domain protein [Cuculus canorus]